jgi:heptosyltransferase II
MKVLIELPTWLGDAVMATPAIKNLENNFDDAEITLIGSSVSIDAIKNHPKVIKTYILDGTYSSIYRVVKCLGEFDIFLSFRGSLRSKFMKFFISAKSKFQFDNKIYKKEHQVEKYNNFINDSLNINSSPGKLILHNIKKNKLGKNKILGINPGASYGDAKRWYPDEFANVASALSNEYDIVIFGGPDEKDIAGDIEKNLIKKGVTNYQNLAAHTSISELMSHISNLDLFVTGDSGPMHLAACFQIPTVSIFGPTKDTETSQWMNKSSFVLKKTLDCQPCMKRSCPLKHHNCMKLIKAKDVLNLIDSLV